MFELEVVHTRLAAGTLPDDIAARFRESRGVSHMAVIKWEEHCTECAWPRCYTTCDLYNPRNDGHCRRTIDGFSPLKDVETADGGNVVRVMFKRWGTLTGLCDLSMKPAPEARSFEKRINRLSVAATVLPNLGRSVGHPGLPSRAIRRLKNSSIAKIGETDITTAPDLFVMEIHNPAARVVELSLDIAARGNGVAYIPYRRLLPLAPGFNRVEIPFEEIKARIGTARTVEVSINPNLLEPEDEGLTLYFGMMTFVRGEASKPVETTTDKTTDKKAAAKKVKIAIWDLDNTVWSGTLIEDGAEKLVLRPGVRETIIALDARGIVNSVASKNHEAPALEQLERFGLREYFVFPAVGWGPKGDAVRRITRSFNVGEDTIAFIDDQDFERAEVRASNPKVRTYTHEEALTLLDREEFIVPVTDEARGRRAFYQDEEVRQEALETSDGDYLSFLRQSNIRVLISNASPGQLDRIHELVQRTNQMNFSGNRYSREALLATLSNPDHECFVVEAEDNFGKYGQIGFAVLRQSGIPRIVDLAFSCRVQSKRVEHAVLSSLMKAQAERGASAFEVFFRATDKNKQIAQVFDDLAFDQQSQDGQDFIYTRDLSELPDSSVVKVSFATAQAPAKVA